MRKIFWTKMAIDDFDQNIDFLRVRWNDKIIFDFLEKTERVLDLIVQNPNLGAWDDSIGCNKILVLKHIYLFYVMEKNEIHLLRFWNNFQKPYWPIDISSRN